jgi:hypothetical protein
MVFGWLILGSVDYIVRMRGLGAEKRGELACKLRLVRIKEAIEML